ncbi:PA2778 family cysteine peptidase [Sulfuritalea sp.]|uniref:PA2778 family cysteine peptidase n=1 Tax=Sulfuritalea sp. TaxID=2480090 RepID=UPI00286E18AB|nr:PA2778 family cysteine peptidase [Sulfuritalea sp.]
MLAGLSGCASLVPQTMGLRDAWPQGVADRSELREVPFFAQQEYQCGPAALATTLVHAGTAVTADELVRRVYLPGREGSLQAEMLAAPRRYGKLSYPLAPRFDDLLREVAAGNPVLVLQDTGVGFITNWHYAVVVGFDYSAGELYLRSGETRRLAVPFTVFEYTWKKSNYWAMLTLPPGRIPVTATEPAYLAAVAALERVAEPDASLAAYSAALQRWPDNVTASIGLANRHYARGDLEQAEAVLRRAHIRHPDSVAVINNLAHTLSDLKRNEEALVLIGQAAAPAGSPFAVAVGETRALILQRLGRDS